MTTPDSYETIVSGFENAGYQFYRSFDEIIEDPAEWVPRHGTHNYYIIEELYGGGVEVFWDNERFGQEWVGIAMTTEELIERVTSGRNEWLDIMDQELYNTGFLWNLTITEMTEVLPTDFPHRPDLWRQAETIEDIERLLK